MARHGRRARRHRLRPRDPGAGGAVSAGPAIDRADHPADLRRLPGAGAAGRLDPAGDRGAAAPARNHRLARPVHWPSRVVGRGRRRAVAGAAAADRDRQWQPRPVFRRARRALRDHRRADRLHLRDRDLFLSGADHQPAVVDRRQPHRRRHLEPAAAGGADVRLSRPVDGDDRDRAGHGQLPRGLDRPRQGRAAATCCSARCIWSPGISGSKAADMAAVAPILFPEMQRARRASGRARLAARHLERDVGDDPAEPGPDHDRLGDQHLDRGAVYRRPAAGCGGGIGAGRRRLVSLAARRHRRRRPGARRRDRCAPLSSPCPA